jgi:nitrite reductase (NADH) large subunit
MEAGAKLKIMASILGGRFQLRPKGSASAAKTPPCIKKPLVRDKRLAGVVPVGDAADVVQSYMDWLRNDTDLAMRRRNLLFPEPEPDRGESVAEMEDSVTVCGCTGVTKGAIIQAIHQKGVRTLAQLKESTRASTGCGSCSGSCQQILKAVAPDFEEETKKLLCKCVPFTQENLREIIQSQRLKSVQQVLAIYGNGKAARSVSPPSATLWT